MAYKLKAGQAAGFDILGSRQEDGTIIMRNFDGQNDEQVDEFPDSIELMGVVYGLEEVKEGANGYCWGIYC